MKAGDSGWRRSCEESGAYFAWRESYTAFRPPLVQNSARISRPLRIKSPTTMRRHKHNPVPTSNTCVLPAAPPLTSLLPSLTEDLLSDFGSRGSPLWRTRRQILRRGFAKCNSATDVPRVHPWSWGGERFAMAWRASCEVSMFEKWHPMLELPEYFIYPNHDLMGGMVVVWACKRQVRQALGPHGRADERGMGCATSAAASALDEYPGLHYCHAVLVLSHSMCGREPNYIPLSGKPCNDVNHLGPSHHQETKNLNPALLKEALQEKSQ
jgi:hypothetical protein